MYWAAVHGVFIQGHVGEESHPHIVFAGPPTKDKSSNGFGVGENLFVCQYTPDLWKEVLYYTKGWKRGPTVADGFECSSVWRAMDFIKHNNKVIYVIDEGIVQHHSHIDSTVSCEDCEMKVNPLH